MLPDAGEVGGEVLPPECSGAALIGAPRQTSNAPAWPVVAAIAAVIATLALLADIVAHRAWSEAPQAIAVIDLPSLVASAPALGGDEGREKVEAVIQGLVDAGYVVIDSSAVLGAPESVFVKSVSRDGGDARR
jgi:hypothetical protein